MTLFTKLYPGLFLTGILGVIALGIQGIEFLQTIHFNALIIAIILGIIVSNSITISPIFEPGINFSAKYLLRLAIILLGFKLILTEVLQIGSRGFVVVTIVTTATIFFTLWLGKRMGLDSKLALLIGAGSAICGASAVAAVAPVAKADERDTTFAIATVTIFGTLSMLIYPVIFRIFELPEILYAVWAGSSVHEVAQVVAAGFAAGEEAGEMATLVKLTRVLLVIPMAMIVGGMQIRKQRSSENSQGKIVIPWFVFGFLAVAIINSLNIIPTNVVNSLISANGLLFTVAMAGLGLGTSLEKMKEVGAGPFYVGMYTTIFIAILGFILASLLFN